jgi:hypothetical protein
MQKLEQFKKELKALVNNPDLDNVIDGKIDDVWRHTRNESDEKWLEREKRYCENLRAHLSSEEKQRMEKSHRWSWSDNPDRDSECIVCGLSEHGMYIKPQYCDKEL